LWTKTFTAVKGDLVQQVGISPVDNIHKDCHIVEKSDLWRLLVVYHEGGYYQDLDRQVNIPFSSILDERIRVYLPTHQDINFAQDIIFSAAGSPLLKKAIDTNLQMRRENEA